MEAMHSKRAGGRVGGGGGGDKRPTDGKVWEREGAAAATCRAPALCCQIQS